MENNEEDIQCVPFPSVIKALRIMSYGSTERVMFLHLLYTGCRINELDNMMITQIHGKTIHWKLGKNQKGWRKQNLPLNFLDELDFYRRTHRVKDGLLFGVDANSFRRYFNVQVRPNLGPEWLRLRPRPRKQALGDEYVLQLKGLRKNYGSVEFWKQYLKWGDAGVAAEFMQRIFKHKNKKMAVCHYFSSYEHLGLKRFKNLSIPAIIAEGEEQKRIFDYA